MKKRIRHDYLKPVNLSDLVWYYADSRNMEIIVRWPNVTQTFKVTWKRLDRLRKQAAEARTRGEYKS